MANALLHSQFPVPHSQFSLNPLESITFVFGQPVAGNPTQFIMERAFAAAGLDWRYLTLEVSPERLADAVKGARAMGFQGGNITMPHKVAVIEHLDELTHAASVIQAVNCIKNDRGRLVGDNTDGRGFLESLRAVSDPAGKRIAVLGAGGAARAIAVELALAKAAEITIVNRSAERGEALAAIIRDKTSVPATFIAWQGDYAVPPAIDALVNATSIGLFDSSRRVPIKIESLRPGLVVADVIFNPPDTRLLHEARHRRCKTLDGLGMLVNQAVIGFRWWTGVEPDRVLMRESLEEYLSI